MSHHELVSLFWSAFPAVGVQLQKLAGQLEASAKASGNLSNTLKHNRKPGHIDLRHSVKNIKPTLLCIKSKKDRNILKNLYSGLEMFTKAKSS